MLNMKFTRIFQTEVRAVESGAVFHEEGMAMVETIEGGETKVKPSTGAAGEIFAGVSLSRNAPPALMPNIEEGVVPASLSVKLAREPQAGQLLVKVGGVAQDIVSGVPAAGDVQVAGDVLTFNSAAAGSALFVQYLFEPSLKEARTIIGDAPIGGLASTAQNVIGAIIKGEFATNFFDASADWSSALQVALGANGTFTVATGGNAIPNVVIRSRPSSANSMLVLAIN